MKCQQVNVEHQHPWGLVQPIQVWKWKLEIIVMDFTIGLPRTINKNDSIMVVIDKLSK